jgi:putative hemolysin
MYAIGKYRTDIRFLVNDILTNIKNFEPMFIPVNKHGANSREVSKLIEDTYAGDHALLVFPAGLVSRKQPEGIKDLYVFWFKIKLNFLIISSSIIVIDKVG